MSKLTKVKLGQLFYSTWREGRVIPDWGQRESPAIEGTEAGIDDEVKPAPKTTKKNAVADTIEAGEIL